MKFLLSLSLSFLLFAAASSNASSFAEAPTAEGPTAPDDGPTPPLILDATGAPLQFGAPYYMLPAIWAWGGGVILADPTPFQPCPKMIRLSHETDRGTPVIFTSAVPNVTGNITIGSELIISFYNLTRPNDQYCGSGSNSTTWVTTRTWNLAVGGEEMSTVFRLSLGGVARSFFLKPVSPFKKMDFVVGVDESRNLVVTLPETINLSFVFQKAKTEDEDGILNKFDRVLQMLRKLSVWGL